MERVSACISAAALCAFAAGVPGTAAALTVDIFLISNQTAPEEGSTAPFSFTTTNVYQLELNSSNTAIAAKLVDDFTFNVTEALTFSSQSPFGRPDGNSGLGPVDSIDGSYDRDPWYEAEFEEGAGTAGYVNSEVGAWDDAFIDNGESYSTDANGNVVHSFDNGSQNLDMHRNSWVTFNPVDGGFTDLILAEVGALSTFSLSLCADAECSISETIFANLSTSLAQALAAMPEFTFDERGEYNADGELVDNVAGELDQTFLFRFSDPVYDYVRILEGGKRGTLLPGLDEYFYSGERLEIDFLGVGSMAGEEGPGTGLSAVPLPAGLPLLMGGLGLLGWLSRRKAA